MTGEAPRALSDPELDELELRIDWWARKQLADPESVVVAVERGGPDERRWYVRVTGEAKDVFTIWFTLRQRTLAYESYVMPAPEENHAQLYDYVLRQNPTLYGAAFGIGVEDAIFLTGQFPAVAVNDDELDRILGSLWAWVERHFRTMLQIGFASRF